MENEQKTTEENFKKEFEGRLDSSVLPARFAKDYHVVDCIKETSDRSVYVIADREGSRFVLKTGKDKRAEALWQEFHLNEQLRKVPELMIPQAVSCIETDDGCYLMNTYIKGLNLVQYQEKYAPLSEADVVSLMFKMCHIVNILHSQDPPIIHRDIKPENFILEEGTGVLYLVDLDTGRQFYPQKKRDTMFVGTFSQAAPEQFGFSQSDIRTDIYGLGKSMVYLLTGDAAAENLQEYGISAQFRRIVERSTEFDPDNRYADVRQMIRDLKRYQMRRITLPSYRLAVGCAVLFLAVGLAGGYMLGTHYGEGDPAQVPAQTDETGADTDASSDGGTQTDPSGQNAADGSNMMDRQNAADGQDTADGQNVPGKISLRDQAGALPFEAWNYGTYCDAIILDYYTGDKDAIAADCEKLAAALKEDPEINRIEVEDYDKLGVGYDPDFWGALDMVSTIRVRLAYKDHIIYRKIGDYEKYKEYLYYAFGSYLSDPNGGSFLAAYALGESTFEDDYAMYSWILSDTLCCYADAFDKYQERKGEE